MVTKNLEIMEIENLEILKIISLVNDNDVVSLRSIDMRVMKKYPNVIYNNELVERIEELIESKLIEWRQEKASVIITSQGIEFLELKNNIYSSKIEKIYKTYEGKDYTQAEWAKHEAQEWESYKKRTGYVSDDEREAQETKDLPKSRFLYDEDEERKKLNETKGIFLEEKKKKGFWDSLLGD